MYTRGKMTDEQKQLRDRFMEPETRCGHYVSAETKALWKVMLDMIEQVDRICRKHDIKYFLIAGSLLGAVRHKGFIPWDDDIDIALFRDDYRKLEKILPGELPEGLFMQTLDTDPEYPASHMRVRDSRTSGIFRGAVMRRARFNMGIFLDIFPLDGVPSSRLTRRILTWFSLRWMRFVSLRWDRRTLSGKAKVLRAVYSAVWRFLGTRRISALRDWMYGRYSAERDGDCVQKACDWGYDHKYRYQVADLLDVEDAQFEYLTLMIPSRYETILTKTYGDWRKIVKGGALHTFLEVSPSVGYKTLLVEKYGYGKEELAGLP